MELNTWLLFLSATLLFSVTPGPNILHIIDRTASLGVSRGLFSVLGCVAGGTLLMSGSVLGLGVALQSAPWLLNMLQMAGALYLAWLGVCAWRRTHHKERALVRPGRGQQTTAPRRALFGNAFLIAVSNPKSLLFSASFLPQFINPDLARVPQLIILMATMVGIDVLCCLAYAAAAGAVSGTLRKPLWQRRFDRTMACLFAGLSVMVLLDG